MFYILYSLVPPECYKTMEIRNYQEDTKRLHIVFQIIMNHCFQTQVQNYSLSSFLNERGCGRLVWDSSFDNVVYIFRSVITTTWNVWFFPETTRRLTIFLLSRDYCTPRYQTWTKSAMLLEESEGRRSIELFFNREDPNNQYYIFRCGKRVKMTVISYANLVSHVHTAHFGLWGLAEKWRKASTNTDW